MAKTSTETAAKFRETYDPDRVMEPHRPGRPRIVERVEHRPDERPMTLPPAPLAMEGERVCKAEIRLGRTLYCCARADLHGGVYNADRKHPGDGRPVRW